MSSGSPLSPWKMSSRRDAHGLRQLGVQAQALEVAVERHHVARLDEVQHQLDLLGVAVPGGVHGRVARGDHVAADVVEPVDRLVHRALVAGDRRGGEDDRVAAVQLHLAVVAVGHPPQRRQRLALGAGRDDHDRARRGSRRSRAGPTSIPSGTSMWPSVRPMPTFLRIERPTSATLRSSACGGVDDLLDAVDVRGEARHHDPPLAAREHLLQVRARRPTPTARSPGGRRSSSRRTAAARPRGPSSARRETSAGGPSTGVWSNL